MRPMALLMPIGGPLGDTIANGYADAFDRIGWDHMVCAPKTRLQMIQVLQRYDIQMIFTACKYGTPQLPVDIINQRKIKVVIQALLFNRKNETYGGTSECVDEQDPYICSEIDSKIIHSNIEPGTGLWDRYLHRWFEMDMPVMPMALAANLVRGPAHVNREDQRYRMCRQLWTQDGRVYGMGGPDARAARGPHDQLPRRFRLESVGPPRCSSHADTAITCVEMFTVLQKCRSIYTPHRSAISAALVNERTFTIPLSADSNDGQPVVSNIWAATW